MNNAERVLLVGVGLKRASGRAGLGSALAQESLNELDELARSAGARVVSSRLQMREVLDSATVVGRGVLAELKHEAERQDASLIIFDRNLSPAQHRNIERSVDCRVIDRTQLILDIFAKHAQTREGQLQVELAQLNYLLPRLAGTSRELSRLGGGIGTRGPGEQKLETDRRRIRDRIRKIGQSIETVRRQRALRRRARQSVPLGTVALVGYTNAGKSTLFNALTRAGVLTSSKMFATLDPTIRALRLPSRRRVLLSDTVGFIRDLPPDLIAAFRATLEEVQEAALILHVTDVSNPLHAEHDAEVEKILDSLGVADRKTLHVFNKIDFLPPEELAALRETHSRDKIFVSARSGEGLEELLARIDEEIPVDPIVERELTLPMTNGRELAMIYACGRVLNSEVSDGHIRLQAQLPESLANRLESFTA
ncbi:MAG TPA: GTPase HflX [Verrucomicrobiae bacterium]|nr:GTPase HflX [Verrucomicrobiae bacterium]